jgi:hypothetical protein
MMEDEGGGMRGRRKEDRERVHAKGERWERE